MYREQSARSGLPQTMSPGSFKSSFSCGDRFGYFADVDLGCRVFHVCNPTHGPNGEFMVKQSETPSLFILGSSSGIIISARTPNYPDREQYLRRSSTL